MFSAATWGSVTFPKWYGNVPHIPVNGREHGHPWNAATLTLFRAVITTLCCPGGMLWLLMWFYDVAECHINCSQLHGVGNCMEDMLRVLDAFIFSELWNKCITLQKWCEPVLCGPSTVAGTFWGLKCAVSPCVYRASGQQMRTAEKMAHFSFYLTK